jgi:hypothetical protein
MFGNDGFDSSLLGRSSGPGYYSLRPITLGTTGEFFVRVPDDVAKTVVFIGDAEGKPFVPYGTGFIIAQPFDQTRAFQSIVTARHVIRRIPSEEIYVRMNTQDGRAIIAVFKRDGWMFHPENRMDIAVYPCLLSPDQFEIRLIMR